METFSALLAICVGNSPVGSEFPAHRPVTWIFDVFLDLRLNERLSKQLRGWWFKTQMHPLWRHSIDLGPPSNRENNQQNGNMLMPEPFTKNKYLLVYSLCYVFFKSSSICNIMTVQKTVKSFVLSFALEINRLWFLATFHFTTLWSLH